VTISFDVESLSSEPQKLMIDYVIYSVKANGRQTPKVWKLSKRTLQPGEVLYVERVHSLAPVSTRRYYPGQHAVSPQINGQRYGRASFQLVLAGG
jgi:hypothetical protein